MIRITEIKLSIHGTEADLLKKAAKRLRIPQEAIKDYGIYRRSLDARKEENIHYVYVLDVAVDDENRVMKKLEKEKTVSLTPDFGYVLPKGEASMQHRPVVVGFGPAGMFAGLLLAQMGLKPILLERGGDVESRKQAVDTFWKTGKLDTESNVQFGEGGAGTFSDGKLTTRIKDPRCRKVLEEFVSAGAPEEILYDAKPHIGTDLLQGVVQNIREEIIHLGGEVRFFSKLTDFNIVEGGITSVVLADGGEISTEDVVLAVGHSARDTFTLLAEKKVPLAQKPFAMGVRIEHPQEMINQVQYGKEAEHLPAAEYRLTHTTTKGRGVYTFCMCPGGYVVAAASEEGRLAVNGMSQHARDGKNGNAAILVQVFPEDLESEHPLAGMYFQQELEEKAFALGGGAYQAPMQTVGAFLGLDAGTTGEVVPTYLPKTVEADIRQIFPTFMTEALEEAIPAMARRLKGFDRGDAVLTAVESRSSSPIRMVRKENGESIGVAGLYPVGEGAGYAGGIVSAAVDGILAAEHIWEKYKI